MATLSLTKKPTSSLNIWGTPRSDIDPAEYCQDCEKPTEHGHFYTCPTQTQYPRHSCTSQCDNCHTLENCVTATVRWNELLLCARCYLTDIV